MTSSEPANSCYLQLPSACPARPHRLRGLHPQGGFRLRSRAVAQTTDTVALAAEPQGRWAALRSARQLEAKVLKLPPRERARLAERLISSLDDEVDADAEAAWVREGERRLDELNSGRSKGRAAAGVFRRACATLR